MTMRYCRSLATVFALVLAGACSPSNSTPADDNADDEGSQGGSTGRGGSSAGGGGGSTAKGGSGGSATGGAVGSSGGTSGGSGGATGTGGTLGTGGTPGGAGGSGGAAGGLDAGAADMGSADTSSDTGGGAEGGMAGEFTFTSPDFLMISNNRLCHKKEQTSSGSQTSPGLNWSGLPPDTKSIAVSLKDRNGGTHWVMWDIPPTVMGLPRDINNAMKPEGSSNSGRWYGPGAGLPYRTYEYRVWALKEPMLPGGCPNKSCYPTKLMANAIAFKEILVIGTAGGTCPN